MFMNSLKATALATPVLLFALTPTASLGADSSRRPNVILVMTDDQGYGDVAAHGNRVIHTPALDRLHATSVRLTDYHVWPLCTPTRAALLTGQNAVRLGAWGTTWGRSLPRADAMTIADVFSAAGYRTGCFGKWHVGDNFPYRPQDRGFGEVLIHGGGGVGQTPDYWGNDYFDDTYFHNDKPVKFTGYCTDIWFDGAMRFIEASKDKPFFAYVSTNAPHGPYNVAKEYSDRYAGNPAVPNAAFYGMITNIDDNMARLVRKLDELGIAEETILIFTTDNGTAAGFRGGKGFNASMRGTKGSLYDGGHRVPFFIRWPDGHLTGGRDVDVLASCLDVLPTLIDLCGLKRPEGFRTDGVSLAGVLPEKSDVGLQRSLVIQYRQSAEPPQQWNAAVLSGRWRLIGGKALYDIKADPGQKTDVAAQHPEVVEQLRAVYEKWWAEISPSFAEYCHIVLGDDAENPARLNCFDWHTMTPWNQGAVRRGSTANSFWAVEIAQAGEYNISLRRWPVEVDAPITAA
ncbi:MAG: arylsulfatase, partial [Planctomycetes bacterium]|nr:arylsulfatase [Planctomycetota bacterium]